MSSSTSIYSSVVSAVEIYRITAPLTSEAAWEIESLLVKIFEYGNYSLRSALLGQYQEMLNCTFFLAKHKGKTIAAAGCLYAHKNPAIAIVGPIGVAAEYRGNGIGTKLVTSLVKYLKLQGCMAVYLGVSDKSPAVDFFRKLGFRKYQGIVMRLILSLSTRFEEEYFGKYAETKIRRATWGDFPSIMALVSSPCLMYTVDFRRSIFSSKYVKPTMFLSVFPEMMGAFVKHGGFANALVTSALENIVGLAHINRLPGKVQQHIAELDFYVHDNFIKQAKLLVRQTVQEFASLPVERINCYLLDCDKIKRNIIEALGGIKVATLSESVFVDGSYENVLVYQLKGNT